MNCNVCGRTIGWCDHTPQPVYDRLPASLRAMAIIMELLNNKEGSKGMGYDPQRKRLYDMEAEVFVRGYKLEAPYLRSLDEVDRFVRRVTRSDWWRRYNGKAVNVLHVPGDYAQAFQEYNEIWLPRWAWNRMTILHELAHLVTAAQAQAHGPTFTRRLIEAHELFGSRRQARRVEEVLREKQVKIARRQV